MDTDAVEIITLYL